jgi:hypothetical protein
VANFLHGVLEPETIALVSIEEEAVLAPEPVWGTSEEE